MSSPEHPEPETSGQEEPGSQAVPRGRDILGVATDELVGLTVSKLKGNETAITMMLHYYRQLVDANMALRNENNLYKTYSDAYNKKKLYSNVAAALSLLGSICIGFGVNLLTNGQSYPGLATLIPGIALSIGSLTFAILDSQ